MGIEAALIDSREPTWVQALDFGCELHQVTMLDAGDLHLMCADGIVAVERKTADDFLNTLRDDRLFPQLLNLREFTHWAYLAICGELRAGPGGKAYTSSRGETGFNWSSVQGALLQAQELGVHIVWVPSDADYETSMRALANRDRGRKRIMPPRDIALLSEGEAILAGLPGIGPDKAEALLRYCGSVADALWYLTDDQWQGKRAPGIGEGIKRRVRRALGLEEWAVLHKVDRGGVIRANEEKESVA